MTYTYSNAVLAKVPTPRPEKDSIPVMLTEETIHQRKEKLLQKMKENNLDALIIYGDVEHGGNFAYISGFITRFEEGVIVLHKTGELFYLLGNENLKLVHYAHMKGEVIHVAHFSLPNQPTNETSLISAFQQAGITATQRIGIVGWKLFTTTTEDPAQLFDVPYYLVEAIEQIIPKSQCFNATALFIGADGVRTINNANEIAHYEFGASLASAGILTALDAIHTSISEMELGADLQQNGQHPTVVTIAATGERFESANLYPTNKPLTLGDKLSLTIGYKGGLQSRSGFVIENSQQLPAEQSDYLERVVQPYFTAVCAWLENIHVGMPGGEMYQLIEQILPKKMYGWTLNPGHLTSDEEWMASPIYPQSKETLKSGMLLQLDIIPSIPNYTGTSAECSVLLADQVLQAEIKKTYPALWQRLNDRTKYVREVLGINVADELFFTGNAACYLRPFFLNKEQAMAWKGNQM